MSASQGPHSLAFRVMRLCRPSFQVDHPLRIDPADLLVGEDFFDDAVALRKGAQSAQDVSYWRRFQLEDPSDLMGLPGLLVLPQAFGAIYLGETFCSYISINNSSKFEVREVVIKAEIQTERQRILLLDTARSPVESIRSGGRYDFIVEHDVKELGPHTLVCTALYNDADGERKYLPQFFKFVVANPLSVRTKVRSVKESMFLEACIENHTKSNLYMDQVEFEPSMHRTVTVTKLDGEKSNPNVQPIDIFRPPVFIRPGGSRNYLYHLETSTVKPTQVKSDGGNILGKLQITWRTNLGEPGRLQTQQIAGSAIVHKEIELRVMELPSSIVAGTPFVVNLSVINHTEKRMGPFQVLLSQDISEEEKVVMAVGPWVLDLPELDGFGSTECNLNLVATKVGIHKISGIAVIDSRERKTFDMLAAVEIFVVSS